MNHTELSDRYIAYIQSFTSTKRPTFDLDNLEISRAIFTHIYKIKTALWIHNIGFNRQKRIAISDIFHEMIAYYLKLALDKESYEIILEHKLGKLQPDILIQYRDKNLFIIEIKTSIGWDRQSPENSIKDRISDLSAAFNIPKENVIYIFQSPNNVNTAFREKYWNKKLAAAPKSELEFPFNQIRPLLVGDDPYYIKYEKSFDKAKDYTEFSIAEITEFSKTRIVVPLELTIKEIKSAASRSGIAELHH